MKTRYAAIDLGTNTFHMLVVEKEKGQLFREIYRRRHFIKLAEDGIATIGKAPYERGMNALRDFRKVLDELAIKNVKTLATAALRTASNGAQFIEQVREETRIDIELITGDQEAKLIYEGVKQAIPLGENRHLIMDIGGGSVEFIIADENQLYWAQSFPIGAAVLYKNFHHSEPIAESEIKDIYAFLDQTLAPFFAILQRYPIHVLVGSSGTFDVLEDVLTNEKTFPHGTIVPLENYPALYTRVINANLEERRAMVDLPDTRSDMIVVAIILVDYIFQKLDIKQLIVSNYAMKEGILGSMIEVNEKR